MTTEAAKGPLAGTTGDDLARPFNPFVGPEPIPKGHEIFGREAETSALCSFLIVERIVLLHSPSGAGKSSLLNAAVLPWAEDEGFSVWTPTRVNHEPPASGATCNRFTWSAISGFEEDQAKTSKHDPEELAKLPLDEYVESRIEEQGSRQLPLLVFDQFEEILTTDPLNELDRRAFFAQLGAVLRNPKVWAIFAIREDYLGRLDPYVRPIPTRLRNRFRIDLLGQKAACDVFTGTARQGRPPREFEEGAARKLSRNLAKVIVPRGDGSDPLEVDGLYVEPVQLQVVGRRVWNRMKTSETTIWYRLVERPGTVDEALQEYYGESVDEIARAHATATPFDNPDAERRKTEGRIRRFVGRELIVNRAIRGQVMQEELDETDVTLLEALRSKHLVRAEVRAHRTLYELAHDRLIKPILDSNQAYNKRELSLVQRRAETWDGGKRSREDLLRGRELREGLAWARENPGLVEDVESQFLQESRSARTRRWFGWAFGLLFFLATIAAATSIAIAFAVNKNANSREWDASEATSNAALNSLKAGRATEKAETDTSLAEKRSQRAAIRVAESNVVSLEADLATMMAELETTKADVATRLAESATRQARSDTLAAKVATVEADAKTREARETERKANEAVEGARKRADQLLDRANSRQSAIASLAALQRDDTETAVEAAGKAWSQYRCYWDSYLDSCLDSPLHDVAPPGPLECTKPALEATTELQDGGSDRSADPFPEIFAALHAAWSSDRSSRAANSGGASETRSERVLRHGAPVRAVAWKHGSWDDSPLQLITAGDDGRILIWPLVLSDGLPQTRQNSERAPTHYEVGTASTGLRSLLVLDDGLENPSVVAGDREGVVTLWRLPSGTAPEGELLASLPVGDGDTRSAVAQLWLEGPQVQARLADGSIWWIPEPDLSSMSPWRAGRRRLGNESSVWGAKFERVADDALSAAIAESRRKDACGSQASTLADEGEGDSTITALLPPSRAGFRAFGRRDGQVAWFDQCLSEEQSDRRHGSTVTALAALDISPDGDGTRARLATSSLDGEVHLWSLARRGDKGWLTAPPVVLTEHGRWVWAVAFSNDGRYLATGAGDGTARIWFTDVDDLVNALGAEATTDECQRTDTSEESSPP